MSNGCNYFCNVHFLILFFRQISTTATVVLAKMAVNVLIGSTSIIVYVQMALMANTAVSNYKLFSRKSLKTVNSLFQWNMNFQLIFKPRKFFGNVKSAK